mgnify:CR=1 FL=1
MTPKPKPGAIGRTVGKFVSDVLNRLEARTAENAEMISDLDSWRCQELTTRDQFADALKFALVDITRNRRRLEAAEERIELLQALEKRRSS